MVQINFAQKQVNAKIVYYGPGMSGKTTNLEIVHQRAPDNNRGELTSISTDGDRTLFFDYMPLDLGTVAGMRTCFQCYTVPGQVYYNSTRKLVLQGVDGVIFVADSSRAMLEQNLESLRNLEENLNEYGKSMNAIPYVIQYNKRDLPDAMPVEELNEKLNRHGVPYFEAMANTGQGVFPTLKRLAALVLQNIMSDSQESAGAPQAATPAAPPAAPAAAAPAAMAGMQAEPAPARRAPAPQPAPTMRQPQPARSGQSLAAMGGGPGAPARPSKSPAAPAHGGARGSGSKGRGAARSAPSMDPGPAAGRGRRASARKQEAHRVAAQRPAPARSGGGGKVYTAAFVVLAVAVGALLASVILSVI